MSTWTSTRTNTNAVTGAERRAASDDRLSTPPVGSMVSTLAAVGPAIGSAAAGGLAFRDAYQFSTLLAVCAVAAFLPGLVVVASAQWFSGFEREGGPGRRWISPVLSAVVWLLVLPPAARALAAAGTRSPGLWSALPHLPDGPYRLLAGSLPVTATPVLLLLIGTLVWWAALCTGEAAVRGAGPVATLCAPTLVLAAGTSVTARLDAAASLPAAAGVLGCGVLLLLTRRRGAAHTAEPRHVSEVDIGGAATSAAAPGPAFSARGALTATAAAAAVAVGAIALTPLLPGLSSRAAADPRRFVHPAAASAPAADPLSQVAAWLTEAPRPLFTVRTTAPVNTRWLILDQYDGNGWGSSARYAPTGQLVAGRTGTDITVPTSTVTQTITIGALPGPWLPTAPTPLRVSGALVSADPQLGVLATDSGRPAQGMTYTVASEVPRPALEQLAAAVPDSRSDSARAADLSVPAGLPPSVAALGRAAMLGAAYPYQQLVQLQNWLRSALAYDPHAFPAEAYGNLALVVGVTHDAGQDVFATLFAVLARAAGFPARIAVGFGSGHLTAAGTYQVTTADALVWPEVYLRGLGWTAFYPVPARQAAASGGTAQAVGEPPQQASLDQRVAEDGRGAKGRRAANGAARVQIAPGPGASWPVLAGFGAGILAGAALVAYVVLRLIAPALARTRRRRRRRRDPDPRRRTVGAWQDALESVGRSVGEPLDALTAAEVAQHADRALRRPGVQERMLRLARLSQLAIFAPDATHFNFSAHDAEAAWREADQVRRMVNRSRLLLQRTPAE